VSIGDIDGSQGYNNRVKNKNKLLILILMYSETCVQQPPLGPEKVSIFYVNLKVSLHN
jgi:hypothetical protein